jgi:hypothetical protein
MKRFALILGTAGLSALALSACADETPFSPKPPAEVSAPTALGIMEITISGIGSSEMSASAAAVAPGRSLPKGVNFDLIPVEGIAGDPGAGTPAEGGIQLVPLSTGSFTEGTRDNNGVRYIWATYRVRNATTKGTAYEVARRNLTFLAIRDGQTINGTAISELRRFDGSEAASGMATGILPTGAVHRDPGTGEIVSTGPDVLQLLKETEVEAIDAPAGVTDIFPYGFVVRNASDNTTRALPADPALDQFDGIVTFAFKVPLQASAADDPFTISFRALAVEDTETRITQSIEEQNAAGEAAVLARAAALGVNTVTLLPGSVYSGGLGRSICSVRAAGPASAPTAFLGQLGTSWLSFSPDPYDPGTGFIAANAQLSATFAGPVSNAGPSNFTVRGLQSGNVFFGQGYSGNGTATITTPAASFFPGEEVEVAVTPGIQCVDEPRVARMRVASTPASEVFDTLPRLHLPGNNAGFDVAATALADLDGDGKLDIILAAFEPGSGIWVALNDGAGDFSAPISHAAAPGTEKLTNLAVGDLNGDGIPDMIVARTDYYLSVLIGTGGGNFATARDLFVGYKPTSIALGDLNGDGKLDLVLTTTTHNGSGDRFVRTLLGRGDGTFETIKLHGLAGSGYAHSVTLGDFNNDGKLDLAVLVADFIDPEVGQPIDGSYRIFFGRGDGTFEFVNSWDLDGWLSNVYGNFSTIGDFNNDGWLDLAVVLNTGTTAANTGHVQIFTGSENGTFTLASTTTIAGMPTSIFAADLTGIGNLDVVVGHARSEFVSVLRGDGAGGFAPADDYQIGVYPYSITVGDLNGDGRLDIVGGNNSFISVLLNSVPGN